MSKILHREEFRTPLGRFRSPELCPRFQRTKSYRSINKITFREPTNFDSNGIRVTRVSGKGKFTIAAKGVAEAIPRIEDRENDERTIVRKQNESVGGSHYARREIGLAGDSRVRRKKVSWKDTRSCVHGSFTMPVTLGELIRPSDTTPLFTAEKEYVDDLPQNKGTSVWSPYAWHAPRSTFLSLSFFFFISYRPAVAFQIRRIRSPVSPLCSQENFSQCSNSIQLN